MTYGNGVQLSFTYDALDRITQKVYSDSSAKPVTYSYGASGELRMVKDLMGGTRTLYTYDLTGRTVNTSVSNLSGKLLATVGTSYTPQKGTVAGTTLRMYKPDDGTVLLNDVYGYEYGTGTGSTPVGLISKMRLNGVDKITYSYDNLGRLQHKDVYLPEMTYSDQTIGEAYFYEGAQETANVKETNSRLELFIDYYGVRYRPVYDPMGNITEVIGTDYNTGKKKIDDYSEYDAHNRLTYNSRISEKNREYDNVMEYDDRGNISERRFQDQGDGSNNRHDHFEYTDSTWGDLLTKYNNTTITYDAIGNPLSYRDGITMTWKNGRRLATFTKGDVSASFDYDADGLRTTKTVGTSRVDYYRAGGLLLGEVHTNGSESYTINYMYDESGRMLGFRLDGEEYYYVRDYAGDVTGLINARGELIGSYLYDPWGVLLETYLNTFEEETSEWTDADRAEYMRVLNLNPIRYKSYYYDTETGFYYLQSRYYDPITTRFINADGLISTGTGVLGYNMFAYCNNNPIMYSDSTGMSMVLDNKGMMLGSYGGGSVGATGGGLLTLVFLWISSLIKSTSSPAVDPAPSIPSTSVPKDREEDTAIAEEKTIADTSPKGGTTYYHVTTLESALSIQSTNIMYGGALEGGYVFAWRMKPNKYAVKNSGAHPGVIISFKTNAAFCDDNGIDDPRVSKFMPVVSVSKGPICVWDVQIVG